MIPDFRCLASRALRELNYCCLKPPVLGIYDISPRKRKPPHTDPGYKVAAVLHSKSSDLVLGQSL